MDGAVGDRPRLDINTVLGHIWAACQAEMLTYRRQSTADPWMSDHLSLDNIARCLETGNSTYIPYIGKNLLKEHCICGRFPKSLRLGRVRSPRVDEVCREATSDLERPESTLYLYESDVIHDDTPLWVSALYEHN
jgi:hypothetical protein